MKQNGVDHKLLFTQLYADCTRRRDIHRRRGSHERSDSQEVPTKQCQQHWLFVVLFALAGPRLDPPCRQSYRTLFVNLEIWWR